MFQYGPLSEVMLHVEHQHRDGTWSTLEPEEAHDPAEHDPEQDWQRGHIYVCPRCQERVRIRAPEGESRPQG